MPDSNGNGKHPANGDTPQPPVFDPLVEAEAVKALLMDALTRTSRLISALKHHRKQSRAVRAAVQSLRELPPLVP